MIDGVRVFPVIDHADERQVFRTILQSDRIRQVSHCIMHTGVAKPRHYHRLQTDWWYVPLGALALDLCDVRPDSPTDGAHQTVLLGSIYPPQVVKIPPGVLHGCRVLEGPCHLIYATDRVYDAKDELRA